MKRWRYALLIFELFLFALILVLPQVDLPDFTFPGGSAPIIAKSRLSAPPVLSVVRAPMQARSSRDMEERPTRGVWPVVQLSTLSLVTLTSILRC
jgi:hypothetical protein